MNMHIRPAMDDALSAPMWTALREHRLLLQQCTQCSYTRFPAAELCPECWNRQMNWQEIHTTGTVWSYTTYERALHPELESAVPYTIAFIELDGGPIIPGRIHTNDDATMAIGARVTGRYTDVDSGFSMLEWVLDDRKN